MQKKRSLLANGDVRDFNEAGRRMFRWVLNATPAPPETPIQKPTPVNLVSEIEIDLDKHIRRATRWARAICVEVRQNDGMTWSAEMVRAAAEKRYPKLTQVAVGNEPGALSGMAVVLGERGFMRRAVAAGLADPYPTLRSWQAVVLLVLFVLTFANLVTEAFAKHLAEQWKVGLPATSWFVTIAITAMLTVVAQWFVANHPVLSFKKSKEKFRSIEHESLRAMAGYDAFIEALANDLAISPSKIIIIDNYGSQDEISHAVLDRYFEEYHARVEHCHYWVIFDSDQGDRLSVKALQAWKSDQYLHPTLYTQEYLSEDARRQLAEKIKQPGRAAFHAVKSICRPTDVDDDWIRAVLQPCLSHHANPLTLRYVYLLSLALTDLAPEHREQDACGCLFFSWDFLADVTGESSVVALDGLSRETAGVRASVLQSVFGQPLNRTVLESIRRDIRQYLHPLFSAGRASSFCVMREVATFLVAHASEYDLPHFSVGKLYWAFVVAQKKSVSRAFWARYVIRQILEIDVSLLPESLRDGAVEKELRNLATQMCDAALRGCLFGELPPLIRFARLRWADDATAAHSSLRSLLRCAWQAYHVTGDEHVLVELVEIYLARRSEQISAPPQLSNIEHAFSESLTLVPEMRSPLERLLLATDATIDSPEARTYAMARGCWVILTGLPFLTRFSANPPSFRVFDPSSVIDVTDAVVDEAVNRLADTAAETRTLDVAALSTAVWCRALAAHPGTAFVANSRLRTFVETPFDESRQALFVDAVVAMGEDVLSAAEKAVTVAAAYMKQSRHSSAGRDLLNSAMVGDTCAVAVAAVWLARHYMTRSYVAPRSIDTRVQRLLADVDEALGTDLATAPDEAAIRSRISDLLHISAMVWKRFGLDRMSEFDTLRYVRFTFDTNRVHAYDEARQQPLQAALEPFIREQHFGGIAANLVLASCLDESAELSAIHLAHAAVLSSEAAFGEDFKSSVALAAALNSGSVGSEIVPILERLLTPEQNGKTPVGRFVEETDDEHVEAAALHLLNAARRADDPEMMKRMTAAIREGAAARSDSPQKAKTESLLEFTEIENSIDFATADAMQVLQLFKSKRDEWTYSTIVQRLRRGGSQDQALTDEALQLLAERDAVVDPMNTWYHLALDVAEDLLDSDEEDAAARYVRDAVLKWQSDERAETNMRAYKILLRRSPRNGAYIAGLAHAQQLKIKRDRTKKLPYLAMQGKYFLIFADYVEHMHVWGLPFDTSSAEFGSLQRQSEADVRRWVDTWIAAGRTIPDPLVMNRGLIAANATFLLLGYRLFSEPYVSDETLSRERAQLNESSRAALPRLVRVIEYLQSTPVETKNILREYGLAYSAPDASSAGRAS